MGVILEKLQEQHRDLGNHPQSVWRIETPPIPLHEAALQKLEIRDLFDLA
jgi:hypothetical protein